jgi:hypothetical protein
VRPDAEVAYAIYRGTALEGPAYRVVRKCPPTAEDFTSYASAGRTFHTKMFFRVTGVSMFMKRAQAEKLARGSTVGSFVATLDLNDEHVYVTLTNQRTGHLVVWATPRLLVECVLECVDIGGEDG